MMEIEIISFGKIAEFIESQKIMVEGVSDTDTFHSYLQEKFPKLKQVKYKLALNNRLVQQNTNFGEQPVIAIMPPFSGG
ncbi:MoaD/ThiS family protein [Pedobacter sp. PWIIR3]